jgi:hypothetical protein
MSKQAKKKPKIREPETSLGFIVGYAARLSRHNENLGIAAQCLGSVAGDILNADARRKLSDAVRTIHEIQRFLYDASNNFGKTGRRPVVDLEDAEGVLSVNP